MGLIIDDGNNTAGKANVDANHNLQVNLPYTTPAGVDIGGGNEAAGGAIMLSESDAGSITGTRSIIAPEADSDFRLRVALETQLDDETFNYSISQNSGKHTNVATTMAASWNTSGLLTNTASITTTTTGLTIGTYAYFPVFGGGVLTYCQFKGAFSAQPVANSIIDVGMFLRGAANPYAPTDGVYFRLTSAGLMGVINHNGTETTTSVFSFTYVNSTNYQFLISIQEDVTKFWINDICYGEIATPIAQGQPCMAAALPFSLRHSIVGGAAGGVLQFTLRDYNISLGGVPFTRGLGEAGNATFGSYQALSGASAAGTLGTYTNSANPAAAVPTNTTAAVGAVGLLNQAWETFSLAVNTDGILLSYQVPAGTVSVLGKRLKVTGIKLSSFVQTVLVGGPIVRTFALAFGHTAVSMATAESTSTKARRIVLLPELTQVITVNQAVSTMISQPGGCVSLFPEPIYVNPGEFVAVTVKGVGTVGSSGTIVNHIQLIYSWE